MEKRVLSGFVIMLMYLVVSGFSQEVKSQEAEWERFLIEAQQPILLTLTSSLCGVPCAIVEDQVAQFAKTYGNNIIFYNANILEKPFLARLYKVLKLPTLIVFKGGKEIKRLENDFNWGSLYDLIFKSDIFYDQAPSPLAPAPSPFDDSDEPNDLIESLKDAESWSKTLVEAQRPIVVTVTSYLCGAPCAILEDRMTLLAKTFSDRIIFVETNILVNPIFASLFKVLNVPTVIVFKNAKEIIRFEENFEWGEFIDFLYVSRMIDTPSDSASPVPSPSRK